MSQSDENRSPLRIYIEESGLFHSELVDCLWVQMENYPELYKRVCNIMEISITDPKGAEIMLEQLKADILEIND